MNKRDVPKLGNNLIFQWKKSTAEAEKGLKKKKKGVGEKGKNQKRNKGKKEKKEARSPDLLKRLENSNFFGRYNGTASPKSFSKWNEVGKQNWSDFVFEPWNYRACKRWGV